MDKDPINNRIELQILDITSSQVQTGAFVLLLGEVNGDRKLHVAIGPAEAQAIVVYLRKIPSARPLTHDLFATTLSALKADLLRVLIHKAQEGVFHSYLFLKTENELFRIDARTSDAIGLAIRLNCPIFIYESILEEEHTRLFDTEDMRKNDEKKKELLKVALKQAIEDEDYERAAQLRDRINHSHHKHQ